MSIQQELKIPQELIPSDPRFGCGPSLIPVKRLEDLLKTGKHFLGTSHRQDRVKKVVAELIDGLRTYFQLPADYDVVLGNGGATFLFDMLPLGLVTHKATHFTCGEFSQKWFASSARIPWIKTQEIAAAMGQGITPYDDESADFIATTLNETSTGVQLDRLPPVHEKKRQNGERLIGVDATSGAGQIPLNISECDVFFFSPQKVFASDGGFWVCFMSPQAVARSQKIAQDKNRYIPDIMRFDHAIENSRKAQTYNTPSLTTIFFLNEQVKEMNQLGMQKVCSMAANKAKLVYSWANEKNYLTPYIQEEKFRSQSVATINVDSAINVEQILMRLSQDQLVYGIEAYRKLGKNQLRIALFHNITIEDVDKLTRLLSFIMEKEKK